MSTKKVLKNSMIYTFVSILQKAISFFLLPVYTIYLSTQDYGITSVVSTIVSFFSIFFMLSLNSAAIKFTYDDIQDETHIKKVWGTIFTFILINSFVIMILLIISHNYFIDKFAENISFYPFILIGVFTIFFNTIYNFYQTYLKALQQGKKTGLNSFFYFFVNIMLTIVFVIVFNMKALGVILSNLITNIIFVLFLIPVFLPKIKLGIDKNILKKSFKYSLPLIPHDLSGWIMALIDRIFLNNMKSTASVGIYNIGFQFANLMNIFTVSVNQAFQPWFFENYQSNEGKIKIKRISMFFSVLYSYFALIISFFSKEILFFMVTKDFRIGYEVIPFLSFSFVLSGFYYFFSSTLFFKNTKLVPFVTISGAIINSVLNFVLIPKYDMNGAGFASFISMLISSLITLLILNKEDRFCYDYYKMYLIFFIFFGLSFFSYAGIYFSSYIFFCIKLLIVLIVTLTIYFYYKKDIKSIKEIIFKKK